MRIIINSISRTFDFKSRSRAKELFIYILFLIIQFGIILYIEKIKKDWIITDIWWVLYYIRNVLIFVLFFSFLPLISLLMRRLHDINLSGLYIFVPIIIVSPIYFFIDYLNKKNDSESYYDINKMEYVDKTITNINSTFMIIIYIIILIFLCLKHSDGDNKYGKWIKPD